MENKSITNTEHEINEVCDEIASLLIQKNRSYGDSALTPKRIFSRAPADEQINVRLDDKLSRIMSGNGDAFHEDVELDLIGYLILKRIHRKRNRPKDVNASLAESSSQALVDHKSNTEPTPIQLITTNNGSEEDVDDVITQRKRRRGEKV